MKSNPLATRFVAPGRIAWQSVFGVPDVHQIAELCLNRYRARCAITGPHGSGKSTLIEHLIPLLGKVVFDRTADSSIIKASEEVRSFQAATETPTRAIVRLRLRGLWASTRLLMLSANEWFVRDRILIIDGYEQLPRVVRAFVIAATRYRRSGLIVTSHRRTALPTLVELKVDADLARHLLDQLLPPDIEGRSELLDRQTLKAMLNKHRGNVRELFMELYDVIESPVSPKQ